MCFPSPFFFFFGILQCSSTRKRHLSVVIGAVRLGGRRASGGVIFDPDFDLYTRKTNCFDLSDNSIAAGPQPVPGPSPISPGPTPLDLPNRPLDVGNTPVLVVNPTPHTSGSPPPPLGPSLPPPGVGDRLYFSHDLYPLYKYPTLYESNYPSPNEEAYIPGGYAANAPEVDERYRPHYGPIEPAEDEGIRPTPHSPQDPSLDWATGMVIATDPRRDIHRRQEAIEWFFGGATQLCRKATSSDSRSSGISARTSASYGRSSGVSTASLRRLHTALLWTTAESQLRSRSRTTAGLHQSTGPAIPIAASRLRNEWPIGTSTTNLLRRSTSTTR